MATLFPVTMVGSWSRSPELLDALRKRQAGELGDQEFQERADQAVLECLRLQDEAGVDIVTDGEQRRDNFYSFVVDKLDGARLMSMRDLLDYMPDPVFFENVMKNSDVVPEDINNAIVVDKLRLTGPGLAVDEATFLVQHTDKPVKVALPGPYHLTRSGWSKAFSESAYPTREDLADDVTALLRQEVERLRDAGVAFVQFDEPSLSEVLYSAESEGTFYWAALGSRRDATAELEWAVGLMNRVVGGVDGVRRGVHVCRGNWSRREDVHLQGDYAPMLPYLVQMEVDQLVLEMATPRAGEIDVFREYGNHKEIGVGVVNPRSDRVEQPAEIVARVEQLLKFFDPEKIFLNPDCGFGTFAERPLNPPEVAAAKMRSISSAAEQLRSRHGG